MIKVLKDWLEIGEANKFLSRKGLPKHFDVQKNWDLYQLFGLVEAMPREIRVVDLGCGELMALKFLYAVGFKNLYGIELQIPWRNRLSQLSRMRKERSLKVPFHLYKGDLIKTKFPNQAFDLAICISVIEHGVDLEKFFSESHRILKPEGLLFITTDYWEEEIQVNDDNRPLGLHWKVFSKKDIEHMIELSYKFGFSLYQDSSIPQCSDKCILWNNQEYTFLNLVLKKENMRSILSSNI